MQKEEVVNSITSCIFIIIVLAGLVLLLSFCFRPTKWLEKSRDGHRVEDLKDLVNATNLYLADNKNFDSLETGKVYSSSGGETLLNGKGWVPLDFQSISSGAPLTRLPNDPTNDGHYYYRFGIDVVNKTYEIDCVLEAGDNEAKMLQDGGNNPARYELGTDLTILK